MKDWQRIRQARTDLTDYVIHFTKNRGYFDDKWADREKGFARSDRVFWEILNEGVIRPTFGKINSQTNGGISTTVRGPDPAVCLTEQPLSAVLVTREILSSRYSGFGIAYHKYALHLAGDCPVIYGSVSMLGTRIWSGQPGYEDGKEIYKDGLPESLQYLFVNYKPNVDKDGYPVDFTWEREWRIKPSAPGLPVVLTQYASKFPADTPIGALIVEKDDQVESVRKLAEQKGWGLFRIVSLETVAAKLKEGDNRYARIETYPDGPALGESPNEGLW